MVTSTSSSQPLPPPPLQSIRLVRVESPKSPSKSPMEVNVEPQERPFLLSFLLPRRRHSKGVVRKPRCKGGDDGIDIGCPNSALSTRLDAPDWCVFLLTDLSSLSQFYCRQISSLSECCECFILVMYLLLSLCASFPVPSLYLILPLILFVHPASQWKYLADQLFSPGSNFLLRLRECAHDRIHIKSVTYAHRNACTNAGLLRIMFE